MIDHPEAPADFNSRQLLIRELQGPLFRIHQASKEHDPPRVAVAVFDRTVDASYAESLGPLVLPEHQGLLGKILETYKFALVE